MNSTVVLVKVAQGKVFSDRIGNADKYMTVNEWQNG